jgi:hypothetical protein
MPFEISVSPRYNNVKYIHNSKKTCCNWYYYIRTSLLWHICMTCLLFFNEKIQDNYSCFEIMLKFNKSPLLFIYFIIFIFFLQTGYICEGKRDIVVRSVIKNVIVDRNNNQKRFYKCQKKFKEVEIIYTIEVKYYEISVSHI